MQASEIPVPKQLRLLGNLGPILALQRSPGGTLQAMYREAGPLVSLARRPAPVVMALAPDVQSEFLSSPDLLHPVLLPGLAYGTQPGSHPLLSSLDALTHEPWYASTVEQTEMLLRRWPIGWEIDAAYAMTTLLFRIVWQAHFGSTTVAACDQVNRTWRQWTHANTLSASMSASGLTLNGAAVYWRYRARQLEDDLRRLLPSLSDGTGFPGLAPAGEQESEDALITRLILHFVVGHACGTTLAWTFFLLSQHPLTLVDLHDKLWRMLHGSVPTLEQLDRLPLLDAIVDESLRLFPPFSIARCLTTASVELAGYELPRGSTVLYSPFLAQRAPDLYLWPHAFRPERWRSIEPEPHRFMPFGADPTLVACLPLATIMIKTVLAMVVQHAFLGLAPNVRIDLHMRVVLEPRRGLPMVVAPVDRPVTRRAPDGNVNTALNTTQTMPS